MDFNRQLNELMEQAMAFIYEKIQGQKELILIEWTPDSRFTLESYWEEVPDIAIYNKLESAEWAIITAIRWDAAGYPVIEAILKGDNYGSVVSVHIGELCAQDIISLAGYLNDSPNVS